METAGGAGFLFLLNHSKGFFMRTNLLRAGSAVTLAAAAALAVAGTSATADPSLSGHAVGAFAQANLVGVVGVHGYFAPSSTAGAPYASVVHATVGTAVGAAVIDSATRRDANGSVVATGRVVAATLPVLAPITGDIPTAAVITAQCAATSAGVTGGATLTHLDLGRLVIAHLGMPNALVTVPGVATVITNEQILAPNGTLTVNGVHVHLLGGILGVGDIVLGSATCGSGTGPSTVPGCGCTTTTIPATTTSESTPPRTTTTTPGGGPNGQPSTTTTTPGGSPNTEPSTTTDTVGPRPSSTTDNPANPNGTPTMVPVPGAGAGGEPGSGTGPEVRIVPAGAPETGDGSLAGPGRAGGR